MATKSLALGEVDTFPFFLARDLGMTLAEMEDRMTIDELVRWRAFYRWERWRRSW